MARVDRAHFQYPSSSLHNGDTDKYYTLSREVRYRNHIMHINNKHLTFSWITSGIT